MSIAAAVRETAETGSRGYTAPVPVMHGQPEETGPGSREQAKPPRRNENPAIDSKKGLHKQVKMRYNMYVHATVHQALSSAGPYAAEPARRRSVFARFRRGSPRVKKTILRQRSAGRKTRRKTEC
jgi:hypothetical protein